MMGPLSIKEDGGSPVIHAPEVGERSMEMMVLGAVDYGEPKHSGGEVGLAYHDALD
jgi:hypothetical protein